VRVNQRHTTELAEGYGTVSLPYALARTSPPANRAWGGQYGLPAHSRSVAPRTGTKRRHHLDERSLQKARRAAARVAGIAKHVTCHTLRHAAT
jgi:integrase